MQTDDARRREERSRKEGSAFHEVDTAYSMSPNMDCSPPLPQHITLPSRLGNYKVLHSLGRGGMGAVHLAVDETNDMKVALKVPSFPEGDNNALRRFQREARLMSMVDHPNVCRVYDADFCDGIHYLAMEYVAGQSLADIICEHQSLPQPRIAYIIHRLALALQAVHSHGVIHRDLKPSNVVINLQGEPILVDFGLARSDRGSVSRLTKTGTAMGTPAYGSPEAFDPDFGEPGPWTDVYSVGVMLYELLAGRRPFLGNMFELCEAILYSEPDLPPKEFRPDLNMDLYAVCRTAMAKKHTDRYQTMTEMADAIEPFIETP